MAVRPLSRVSLALFAFQYVGGAVAALAECAEQEPDCTGVQPREEPEDLVVLLQTASLPQRLSHASATRQARSEIAYIGSTGCDQGDHKCVAGPSELAGVISAVEVFENGALVPREELAANVSGSKSPTWLTVAKLPSQSCLLVSFDPANIVGLSLGTDGRLSLSGPAVNPGGRSIQVATAPTGGLLLSANYNSDPSVSSLQVGSGCGVRVADVSQDPAWATSDKIHGVVPVGNLTYVTALTLDKVYVYSVSPSTGALVQVSSASTPPGCGPRHAAQHPSAPFLYVICENTAEVLTFSEADDGLSLALVQTSADSPGGCSSCKGGEIAILPDGSTLYASNRVSLESTVTAYRVGAQDGRLEYLQLVAAPSFPRAMTLAFEGRVLLVAGQTNTELASFSVEPDGQLTSTGHRLTQGLAPNPGAIAMFGLA